MGLMDYERPSLTTDIVLIRMKETESENIRKTSEKNLQVLLIKRDTNPQKDKWSLPGGFVDIDEEIESNVKRKLKEKTGIIDNFYIEQLYTWGNLNRDERGRVISVSYLGLISPKVNVDKNGSMEKQWFDIEDVKNMNLAFDHNEIIEYAINRLRGKAEYTDIVFNMMPDEFTVHDCQMVYEKIFNRKLDNFKRRIDKYIEPLGKMRIGKQFRPAELYKWKKESVYND